MLNSVYSKGIKELSNATKSLSDSQILLLKAIQSKTRFEQLMEILPDGWESNYSINIFNDPYAAAHSFINSNSKIPTKQIYEKIITDIIVSEKYKAIPGRFDEYLKRDEDYTMDDNKYKTYLGLTEFVAADFHIDHKLIWVTKERRIAPNSDKDLKDEPYIFSINVYSPSSEILENVETIKLNNIV